MEKEETYTYFISYVCQGKNSFGYSLGYGNIIIKNMTRKITNSEDIKIIEDAIERKKHISKVIVQNFILI